MFLQNSPLMKKVFARFLALAFIMLSLLKISSAQCINPPNAIYVVPNGGGNGSAASPTNLESAITIHNNNPARNLILMSGGTYHFFNSIKIPSNITIEGSYTATGGNWYKDPSNVSNINVIPPFRAGIVRNVPRGMNTVNAHVEDSVLVAHIIGFELDSVQNISLLDLHLSVSNPGGVTWLPTRDGYSIYAIYSYKSKNVLLNKIEINTGDAQGGGFGLQGRDGYDAYYYIPGGTEIDNTRTTNSDQPIFKLLPESDIVSVGAAGGYGGMTQTMVQCAGSACVAGGCMLGPQRRGSTGSTSYQGIAGGGGGVCGDACAVDCYFQTYAAFIPGVGNIVTAAGNAIVNGQGPALTATQDQSGRGGQNGHDGTPANNFANSIGLPYEGEKFFVPGTGMKGARGGGGSGGGGGGAGGIRTLAIPSTPIWAPEAADPVTMVLDVLGASLATVNEIALLTGTANDVCPTQILNCSTPGGLGGGGGEGGDAGGGAGGGGSVYGVYSYLSTNIGVGQVTYNLGEPGVGGIGGNGGDGGLGGYGIEGRPLNSVTAFMSNRGAKGGDGGNGGSGGSGQDGGDGKKYETYGFQNQLLVFSIDTSHLCTNTIIGIVKNAQSTLSINMNGSSANVNTISSTPTYREISVSQTGTLHIIHSNTQNPNTYAFHDLVVSTQRPLPAFSIPTKVCPNDSLLLIPADTTLAAYYWRIYLSNGTLVKESKEKSFKFSPPVQTGGVLYRVYLQAFEACCGWSTAAEHFFTVDALPVLTIAAPFNTYPFCGGTDSTRVILSGAPVVTIGQFPNTTNIYPGVKWNTGDTLVDKLWAKDDSPLSVTYTSPAGCVIHTPDFKITNYWPTPTGVPATGNFYGACDQGQVTIYPSAPNTWSFNFYSSATANTTEPGGYQTNGYTFQPYFGFGANLKDSVVIYTAAVSPQGCAGTQRGTALVFHETNPPGYVHPFTAYYHETAGAGCGKAVNYQVPVGADGFCTNTSLSVTRISGLASGSFFPVGTSTVVHRIKDWFGNYTDVTTTIEVTDNTPPVVSSVANVNLTAAPGICGAVWHLQPVTATDNCLGIITASNNYWSGLNTGDTLFGVGSTQFFYEFTDPSGNATNTSYTITVADNQPPVVNCPANKVYYITGSNTTALTSYNKPTVNDNCDIYASNPTFVSGFGQWGNHPLGTSVETYSYTDQAGNTGTCSFNLTVTDSIRPVVTCPNPVYFITDPGFSYTTISYLTPTATDNLAGIVSVTKLSGKASGDTASIGVYTAVWTGTDIYGNTGSCPVSITVSDREGPVLTCPNNITTSVDPGSCTAVETFTIAPAPDNDLNTYNPVFYYGLNSGSAFPLGTTNVIYTVADAQGNKSYCSFNVTVTDNIAPVFTTACPHDTTVNFNPTVCGQYVSVPVLTGTDNSCATPVVAFVTGSFSGLYELGTTTQQYQIRDNAGNTSYCTYNVNVVDNAAFTVTCPPNITRNNDPGQCAAYIPYLGTPVMLPNYSCLKTSGLAANPGPYFPAGTTTLTYSALAVNNNYAQCTFTVTVVDNEWPQITSPANIVADVSAGNCGQVVNFTAPAGTDNCNNGLGTFRIAGLASGSLFPVGTTVQTYVVTDLVGHLDTASFTITVRDTVKPSITAPANVVSSTSDMCGKVMTFVPPVGTDNSTCAATALVSGLNSGDLFPIGTTHQVYVVTDGAGNTDTATFSVIVNPVYPLQASCADNVLRPDINGNGIVVYYPLPGTVDQNTGQLSPCAGVDIILESGQGSGAFFTPGPHYENYAFIVRNTGDTVRCTTNVIVTEFFPPIIDCGATQTYTLAPDSGLCSAVFTLPVPTVTDGPVGSYINLVHKVDGVTKTNLVDTLSSGFHSVEWIANDYSSNISSCTYYVKVVDNVRIGSNFPLVTYCENDVVNIDPQLQGYAEGLTYEWKTTDAFGSYITYSTDKVLHFDRVKLTDQRQYTFVLIDRCGGMTVGNEFLLRVNPAPATTLTGLNSNYCTYDTSDITVSYTPAGGLLTGHGVVGNKFNPKRAGIGTHDIEYAWYDANSGCTGITTKTVVVSDTPTVDFFADTLYCINAGVIQLPVTNSVYTGTGISGTTFNPATAGGGYHQLTRTMNVNGCIGRLKETVRVNAVIPNPNITAPASVCEASGNYILTAATTGGAWTGNFLTIDTLTGNASLNSRGHGFGMDTVLYEVTKSTCTSRDTAYINILDKDYNLPYTLPQFCSNASQLQFDTTDHKQYLGIGFTLTGLFTPSNVPYTGLTFYSVITHNNLGCSDTVFRLLYMRGGQLNIDPINYVCQPGDPVTVNLQSEYDSILWWNGTHDNPKVFTDTGRYSVFLRDTMGCSGYDTVYVFQLPAPAQIVTSTSVSACPSSPATITTANDSLIVKYHWSNGDSVSQITVMPGTYTVTVTNWWGCEHVSPQVMVTTGPDAVLPTITCPHDTSFYTPSGSCTLSGLGLGTAIALDNCGMQSITNNAPVSFSTGVTNVTWTARDLANNTRTCVQHVTVYDSIAPYFTNTPAVVFVVDTEKNNCSTAVPNFVGLFTASDSCSNITLTQTPVAGALVTAGITSVAITAHDASGNTVVYYMSFSTQDTVAPIINCPNSITATAAGTNTTAVVSYLAPTGAANCTNTTVQRIAGLGSGAAFPIGVTTERYVVTDGAGAKDTCSFTVTVNHITGVVEANGDDQSLIVMPVPATDRLTIVYKNNATATLQVRLMNISGQAIFTEQIPAFSGSYNKVIYLLEYAAGTYILELITDKEIVTRKIVKM